MVQQWEYMKMRPSEETLSVEYLNKVGLDGWQLSVFAPSNQIFKRPIGSNWQERCEAAEALISEADGFLALEKMDAYPKWQALKKAP